MTPRERVAAAMAHVEPDFTPCDYFATPEIRQALCGHFGVTGDAEICARLGTDIRYVNPPSIGPPPQRFDDGSWIDEWGVRRRMMPNQYGEYAEALGTPYAAFQTVDDVDRFPWPSPDAYDFQALPGLCRQAGDRSIATGGFYVQDFINRVAMGRGVERVLVDIGEDNPVYLRLVEIRHRYYLRQIERTLDAAGGRIDLVLCGDDFGSQRGLLISPATFDRLFAPLKKEFFDMVHSFGAKVTHHCCGSSRKLIPRFVACGMDALQTIQPQAAGMNPYELKRAFAGQIVLHGAVDVQGWLQRASPAEIRAEVHRLIDEVGRGGGYILAPCHQIQPDTPLPNVLALYAAVAERRGRSLGDWAGMLIKYLAAETTIPLAIALDHGKTPQSVLRAVRAGFTHVMIDYADRPLSENVRGTQEIIDLVRPLGITVEAEIGHIIKSSDAAGARAPTVSVAEAEEFTDQVDVDLLAVAVGSTHGIFQEQHGLDFELISQIRRRVRPPLVLHGTCGISLADISRSVNAGMTKINFGEGLRMNYIRYFNEFSQTLPHEHHVWRIARAAKDRLKEDIKAILRAVGSAGRAAEFREGA